MLPEDPTRKRSTFVTVVAWIFIVIAGFAALISTMQSAMMYFIFSDPRFQATMHAQVPMNDSPQWAQFFFEHPWVFFVSFWVVSLLVLTSAIGLLRRKNWARIMFVAILGLGILWNVGTLVFQGYTYSNLLAVPPQTPPEFAAAFKAMAAAIIIGTALFTIALSVAFGWLIKRLSSPIIKAEFRAP